MMRIKIIFSVRENTSGNFELIMVKKIKKRIMKIPNPLGFPNSPRNLPPCEYAISGLKKRIKNPVIIIINKK
jgi:hypothetical protein